MTALIAFVVLAAAVVVALGAGWALRGWSDVKRDEQECDALRKQVEEHARRLTIANSGIYFARQQARQVVKGYDDDLALEPVNAGRLWQARATLDVLPEEA